MEALLTEFNELAERVPDGDYWRRELAKARSMEEVVRLVQEMRDYEEDMK